MEPDTLVEPFITSISYMIEYSSDVFPHPTCPMMTMKSPDFIEKSISDKAGSLTFSILSLTLSWTVAFLSILYFEEA